MTLHSTQDPYWRLVAASLEAFLGKDRATARTLTRAVRRRFESNEVQGELWYHAEPVNVAEDIARAKIQWTQSKKDIYLSLRERAHRGLSPQTFLDSRPSLSTAARSPRRSILKNGAV